MPESSDVNRAAIEIADTLRGLDPGPLAELRRMPAKLGTPAFWRLAARHPDTIGARPDLWMGITRILAILTPTGAAEGRAKLHDASRRLGAALCDGGDPAWTGNRPMLSERRLAQLLAARGPRRLDALTRAARMLARARNPNAGLDVRDIAWAVLAPQSTARLAEHYYRRLDGAGADRTEDISA